MTSPRDSVTARDNGSTHVAYARLIQRVLTQANDTQGERATTMGLLSGRYGRAEDLTRAFRFQAEHKNVSIRSAGHGAVFVATCNEDNSAHVIAMKNLSELMDKLEEEYA